MWMSRMMKTGLLSMLAGLIGASMVVVGFGVGYFLNSMPLFWVLFLGGIFVANGIRTALGFIEGDIYSHRLLSYGVLAFSVSSLVLALAAYFIGEQALFEVALVIFLVSTLSLRRLPKGNVSPSQGSEGFSKPQ